MIKPEMKEWHQSCAFELSNALAEILKGALRQVWALQEKSVKTRMDSVRSAKK